MPIIDKRIRELCHVNPPHQPLIAPFQDYLSEDHKLSYGLTSVGYDVRSSDEWHIFTEPATGWGYVDPKSNSPESYSYLEVQRLPDGNIVLPSGAYALTSTKEYICMPDNVSGLCMGKSTYARLGLVLNTTPLEPGWEGHITLELYNASPRALKIYVQEGICQLWFFEGERPEVTYRDRKGKYQGQRGVTHARVRPKTP